MGGTPCDGDHSVMHDAPTNVCSPGLASSVSPAGQTFQSNSDLRREVCHLEITLEIPGNFLNDLFA